VTSGGTEANIQAVRIARDRADAARPNVVAPESAHFSFHKAASLLGVELRTAPLSGSRVDVDAMEALWPEGYRETYERAMDNAEWVAGALETRRYDVVGPDLPLVAADISATTTDRLRERGWRVSTTGAGEARLVCMPHVTRSTLRSFVADLDWY